MRRSQTSLTHSWLQGLLRKVVMLIWQRIGCGLVRRYIVLSQPMETRNTSILPTLQESAKRTKPLFAQFLHCRRRLVMVSHRDRLWTSITKHLKRDIKYHVLSAMYSLVICITENMRPLLSMACASMANTCKVAMTLGRQSNGLKNTTDL